MEFGGQLEGFPMEVVKRMLEEQQKQNEAAPDIKIFEADIRANKYQKGFDWMITVEGAEFWQLVITNRDFDTFFARYPKDKSYPKVMLVRDDHPNTIGGKSWVERVVFMEKCGKYLSWSSVKTLEEAEKVTGVVDWNYAKELPGPKIKLTKEALLRELSNYIVTPEALEIFED
jgi:hypothetical protein